MTEYHLNMSCLVVVLGDHPISEFGLRNAELRQKVFYSSGSRNSEFRVRRFDEIALDFLRFAYHIQSNDRTTTRQGITALTFLSVYIAQLG